MSSSGPFGSFWLSNNTTGGSGGSTGRPQQPPLSSQVQQQQLLSTSSATVVYAGNTPKYADVTAMMSQSLNTATTGSPPSGNRGIGNAASHTQLHAGGFYRPQKNQQQQQRQPYGYSPSSPNLSFNNNNPSVGSGRAVSDTTPVYTKNAPVSLGASGGEGQAIGGYAHRRGGSYQGNLQRRRSESGRCGGHGGHGDTYPGPRPQQQQQQQQQPQLSSSSQRSRYGRLRVGGGGFGGGSHSNTDISIHSRIPSASSGKELPPPPPPIDSGGDSSGPNIEVEASHGASDLLATSSSPHLAMGMNVRGTGAAAFSFLYASGGPSARRGSAASGGSGGGGGGAVNRLGGVDPPFVQHAALSSPSGLVGGAYNVSTLGGAGGGGGEARMEKPTAPTTSSPPPQQQQTMMSRSGVSTSSTGTNTNIVAPAVPAPVPPAAGSSVTRYTRPRGEERPTVALSQNIMSVYQAINEIFYQERQKLLAAPAKYAARKYEDTSGHYVPCEGEVIADRYVFKELVGQGSFGKVLHCIDRKYNEPVAVKVIRSGPYFESQGWFEAQVVAHLNNDPSLQNLVVQLRKVFLWKGHMVLVFERLSFSLYKLIALTKHNGVSLDLTRKFAYQMVKVLLVLEQHQPPIIHCDLKPENVLLRDPSRSGVRVIDFGSACYQQQTAWRLPQAQVPLPASSPSASAGPPWDTMEEHRGGGNTSNSSAVSSPRAPTAVAASSSDKALSASGGGGDPAVVHTASSHQQPQATTSASAAANTSENLSAPTAAALANADVEVVMPKYIQSRYYRSPEVILELGYTTAIDRWSLGCFLTEMHTGRPLFQGNNEADMIAYFTMVLGPLPDYMVASSPKRPRFYRTCAVDSSGGTSGGEGNSLLPSLGGFSSTTAAQALLVQQQQQRAASPLVSFSASPTPSLTPFTEAPGHAPGSPFFLRTPQVEDTESATAYAVRSDGVGSPLEKVLGVHTGGPRGCRAGQRGHDRAAYETFCDFIEKLLQYDPRKRMSCSQAIQHPFLEPIRILEARAAAAAAASSSPAMSQHRDNGVATVSDSVSTTTAGTTAATASAVRTAAPAALEKNSDASNA